MHTHIAVQIFFFEQWNALKAAATEKGITLVGDLPIFVSSNGVDTWVNPHLFHLDEDGHPNPVAGVPPDVFSEDGQHWGNPLYKWEAHEAEGFAWWIKRLESERRLTDQIRLITSVDLLPLGAFLEVLVEMPKMVLGFQHRELNYLMRYGLTLARNSPSSLRTWELSLKMLRHCVSKTI